MFDEFRNHNESGLALDQLSDVAHEQRAQSAVWEELRAAATVIGLDGDHPEDGATVRRVNDHLAGARNETFVPGLVAAGLSVLKDAGEVMARLA